MTGDIAATNAGEYTATVALNDKDNYEWAEGGDDNLTLPWSIAAAVVPIYNVQKSDGKQGIRFLSGNVVGDKAEFEVVLPNDRVAEAKVAIYDNIGNVVFEASQRGAKVISWDLTNAAGRNVANGGYLVVAEVRGVSGKGYGYSAKVGVKR